MCMTPECSDGYSFNELKYTADPINRPVEWSPQKGLPYDPVEMFKGGNIHGKYYKGIADFNSWHEIMDGWAKTVRVGRCRIGGLAVGVIAPETSSVTIEIPADPANSESDRKIVRRSGQVWFPDSSHKTAQAIRDFNREQLPLLIMGNWRGFSGGMKDMFDEILKFGAQIVDELRKYKFPIIVYIPPFGELRGGAWAVLDPKINLDYMEIYSAETGRGGILEPSGAASIKYREKNQISTANRMNLDFKESSTSALMERVAIDFVDLHDKPEALRKNNAIKSIVEWRGCRQFLHYRFKRLLLQHKLRKMNKISDANISYFNAVLQRACNNAETEVGASTCIDWTNDQAIVELLQSDKISDQNLISNVISEIVIPQRCKIMSNILEDVGNSSDQAMALFETFKGLDNEAKIMFKAALESGSIGRMVSQGSNLSISQTANLMLSSTESLSNDLKRNSSLDDTENMILSEDNQKQL